MSAETILNDIKSKPHTIMTFVCPHCGNTFEVPVPKGEEQRFKDNSEEMCPDCFNELWDK